MTGRGLSGLRLERRLDISARRAALTRVAGGIIALIIAGVVLQITGRTALGIGHGAINGTFRSRLDLEQTAVLLTPILMCAVAVAIGFRIKVWNIGVEGQFLMGGWAATGVGLYLKAPGPVLLLAMAAAGGVAGALWALGPAVLRAFWGVNEIITTLLMNFIALQWVLWFSTDLWKDRVNTVVGASRRVAAHLPALLGSRTLHSGFLVPLALAGGMALLMRYSRWGFEVDMTGGNPLAARFAGIQVRRRVVTVMLISGSVAGLGGMLQLAGAVHRLSGSLSNQYGFSGFIVAALAGGSVIGLLAVAAFVATLLHSGIALQTKGLSINIVIAIYGLILLLVGVAETAARYRLVRARGPGRQPPGPTATSTVAPASTPASTPAPEPERAG